MESFFAEKPLNALPLGMTPERLFKFGYRYTLDIGQILWGDEATSVRFEVGKIATHIVSWAGSRCDT